MIGRFSAGALGGVAGLDFHMLGCASHHRDERVEVEGLRQIVIGAALGSGDRRHDRVLGAHNDDRQRRPELLDPGQDVKGVLIGKNHVGDDDIALPFAHPAPKTRCRAGRAHRIAGARQGLRHDGPDGAVIVQR